VERRAIQRIASVIASRLWTCAGLAFVLGTLASCARVALEDPFLQYSYSGTAAVLLGLPVSLMLLSWPFTKYSRALLLSGTAAIGLGLSTAVLQNFERFPRPRNQTNPLAICAWVVEAFLYLSVVQLAVVWTRRQFWPRYGPGRCAHCGYRLRGLGTPRCPECGKPFDPDRVKLPGKDPTDA